MAKTRADQLLVDRGLVESRAKAQALILAGLVFSGERKVDKAGQALAPEAPLEVRGKDHPWVSRGGIKLAHRDFLSGQQLLEGEIRRVPRAGRTD